MAEVEPPPKRAKVGDDVSKEPAAAVAAARPAKSEELETSAQPLKGPQLKKPVEFYTEDTTMNVFPSTTGNVLTTLSKGGFQYLLAGARANVGIKSGRYVFEAKIVEFVTPAEEMVRGRPSPAKHFLRLGFSTSQAPLIMGESEHSVAFNSEGQLEIGKKRTQVSQRFERDHVVAVLLNLDEKSPNNNTISLFKDGVRASEPTPLPEALRGKPLFPSLTFKNIAVHVNFGPVLLAQLPFTCHTIAQALTKDVEVAKAPPAPKGGKYEVVYPVSLPDQGSFDWLDIFLEQNPGYTEISDRAILAWAESSGIYRARGYGRATRNCNDSPDMGFGVPSLDDMSIKTLMTQVAPVQRRNFVIMEVRGNLTKEDRLASLARFPSSRFRKVAHIMLGTPTAPFVNRVHALSLKAKQEASDRAFEVRKAETKRKQAEAKRKRLIERRQRALERERARVKKAREDAQAKAKAEKEAADAAAAQAPDEGEKTAEATEPAAQEAGEEKPDKAKDDEAKDDEAKDEEAKAEEAKAEEAKAEEPKAEEPKAEEEKDEEEKAAFEDDDAEMEEDDTPPPTVTLTDEEKQQHFRKVDVLDLKEFVLNASFPSFSLPDKVEGFDELKYEWSTGPQCSQLFDKWMTEKKRIVRIESLKPGNWFREQTVAWQQTVTQWKIKQNEAKVTEMKMARDKAIAKEARDKAKAEAAAQKEKEEKAEKEEKDGAEETTMETDGEAKEEDQEMEEEQADADFDSVDIFDIEDVSDVSASGVPLFKEFKVENWALMQLRFEFHVMVCAFHRDVDDPDRRGMHVDNVLYYYTKYFRKVLDLKTFGVETLLELVQLLMPVVYVSEESTLETYLPAEQETFSVFVKIEEEERRHRTMLVESGDDSAALNFKLQGLAGHNAAAAAALVLAAGQKRPPGGVPLQSPMVLAGRGPRGQAAPPLQMPGRQGMAAPVAGSMRMAPAAAGYAGKGAGKSGNPAAAAGMGIGLRPAVRQNVTVPAQGVVPGLRVAQGGGVGMASATRPPVPARVTITGGNSPFGPNHVPSVVRPPPKRPPMERP